MNYIETKLNDKPLYLLYNCNAMFEIFELYTEEYIDDNKQKQTRPRNILDVIQAHDYESFKAVCRIASIMSEQGELFRRYMGYDPQDYPSYEEIKVSIMPLDYYDFKSQVISAIVKGMTRDEKKKKKNVI